MSIYYIDSTPDETGNYLTPIAEDTYYVGNPFDFSGFHFDNLSSHSMGITRVSPGDRFNLDLTPTIENKTVVVPGGHGNYFFGSYYRDRQITINIAFDSLTEEQIRDIQRIFSPCRELKEFYYDETPYKVYKTKITQPIQLNVICFDEGENHRLYKGEGTIILLCYDPFARSKNKYLNDYTSFDGVKEDEIEDYKKEWAKASGLLEEQGIYDVLSADSIYYLYNPGDVETDFLLIIELQDILDAMDSSTGKGTIMLKYSSSKDNLEEADLGLLVIQDVEKLGSKDKYLRINSKLNLIEGLDKNKEATGYLYNQFISSGSFFNILTGESFLYVECGEDDMYWTKTLKEEQKTQIMDVLNYDLIGDFSKNNASNIEYQYKYY